MAHFAEINGSNEVLSVIVVANEDTADAEGNEVDSIGEAFCNDLLGGTWKRTSYNNNYRVRYAGIGYTFNAELDAFIMPYPNDGKEYRLDEDTASWVEVE